MMYKFQRERQKEKEELKSKLAVARRDLPSCMSVLRSLAEAINVASSLNTSVFSSSALAASGYPKASTTSGGALPKMSTPAENVRKQYRAEGCESLSLEEQQWTMLDKELNPDYYEWLVEQEEEENLKRQERGKKAKKKKFNAAVEAFR